MVRLVLFDIDATLIQTDGAGIKAFGRALAVMFGVPDDTSWATFAGRTDSGLAREFLLRYGIEPSKENYGKLFNAYTHYLDYLLGRMTGAVCPGVWRLICELETLPDPPLLGLLTGNIRLGAEIKLRHFDLWECFKTGAFADDHEDRNEIAYIAKERGARVLGRELRGDDVVVIGDTPHDIRCGKAIDAKVLAVATGHTSVEELRAHHPHRAVKDLSRLRAADLMAL